MAKIIFDLTLGGHHLREQSGVGYLGPADDISQTIAVTFLTHSGDKQGQRTFSCAASEAVRYKHVTPDDEED
ncbi:MAG: hypothetical protein ACRDS0_05930 [Pseudonocardiaceae bacterium]